MGATLQVEPDRQSGNACSTGGSPRGLKIAFVCERFPVISEAFIASSAAALIDRGHEVDIYALLGRSPAEDGEVQPQVATHRLEERLYAPNWPASAAGSAVAALSEFVRLCRRRGARALKALDPVIFRRSAVTLRSLFLAGMCAGDGDYDIIHCQFGHLAHDMLRLRRAGFISGKVVVQFRGYDITQIPFEAPPGFYDEVFRQADYFVANSAFFRDKAIALGAPPGRMRVSFSGIALDNFPFRAPRRWEDGETVRLMTVGRLVEKKGIAVALEAMAGLKSRGIRIHFDIVGEGPERTRLEDKTARLGLEREVVFQGAHGHEYISSLLDQAHLFVAPSLTAANSNADAPINTLKEAMATGVPVVSTWHGGIPELVEDGVSGFLAAEADAGALEARILDALNARESWPQMARAARTKVAGAFSLEATTDALLSIYQEALGQ